MDDAIDLSEAAIDEPDLSLGILDNPVEEPSLDEISINLDMDENDFAVDLSAEETEEAEEADTELELEEITLSEISEEEPELHLGDSMSDLEEIEDDTLSLSIDDLDSVEDLDILESDDDLAELTELSEDIPLAESVPELPAEEAKSTSGIPPQLKQELKTVLSYMDQLLEALPDEKINEFARSEYYNTYKKLFKELGLVK